MIADLIQAYWAWASVAVIGPLVWVVGWEYFKGFQNDS